MRMARSASRTDASRLSREPGELTAPSASTSRPGTSSCPGTSMPSAHGQRRRARDRACHRSAAAGGVTTIVDMPYDDPEPGQHARALRAEGRARRGRGPRRRRPLRDRRAERRTGRDRAAPRRRRRGLQGLDVRDPPGALSARARRRAAACDGDLRRLGALVCFHPENDDIVRRLPQQLAAEGRTDPMAHADARPPWPRARRSGARSSSASRPAAARTSATSRSSAASRSSRTRCATASTRAPRPARTTS